MNFDVKRAPYYVRRSKWFKNFSKEVRLIIQAKRERALSQSGALNCCKLIDELEREIFGE